MEFQRNIFKFITLKFNNFYGNFNFRIRAFQAQKRFITQMQGHLNENIKIYHNDIWANRLKKLSLLIKSGLNFNV